jgi:very-short-patch-repair endonuclease
MKQLLKTRLDWETLELRRSLLTLKRTRAEAKLCRMLYHMGIPYDFQTIIYPFIIDFTLLTRNCLIELDGSVHSNRDVYDDRRSDYLYNYGFDLYRIYNNDLTYSLVKEIVHKSSPISQGAMWLLIDNVNKKYYPKI